MSNQYHAFTITTTNEDGESLDESELEYYSMEVTITIGNGASGLLINTISANHETIHNTTTVSRMTFTVNNIGSEGNLFVIVPVNSNSTGNNINVSIVCNGIS